MEFPSHRFLVEIRRLNLRKNIFLKLICLSSEILSLLIASSSFHAPYPRMLWSPAVLHVNPETW